MCRQRLFSGLSHKVSRFTFGRRNTRTKSKNKNLNTLSFQITIIISQFLKIFASIKCRNYNSPDFLISHINIFFLKIQTFWMPALTFKRPGIKFYAAASTHKI